MATQSKFQFDYMLLGRMKGDNDYFIETSSSANQLWAGSVKDQIEKMKELWNKVDVKPEWLSFQDILNYEKKMIEINVKNNKERYTTALLEYTLK